MDILLPLRMGIILLLRMGILLFVSANGIATMALKYVPSGMGALISALYPLCVVIIERLFFRDTRITVITFAGLLLGIAGIARQLRKALENPGAVKDANSQYSPERIQQERTAPPSRR